MLNAKELWKENEQQKANRMKAMRPVLAGLFQDIKKHSIHNPDAPYFVFDVPGFVFGYPLFNHDEAVVYVKETLEEQGFSVTRGTTPPSILFISWMKPTPKKEAPKPPKPGPDYRPFVYDEAAFSFLTRK